MLLLTPQGSGAHDKHVSFPAATRMQKAKGFSVGRSADGSLLVLYALGCTRNSNPGQDARAEQS